MKNLVTIFAVLILSTGVTMASSPMVVVPAGDDTNVASHQVGITVPTIALVDVEGASGEASSITLTPEVNGLEAGEAVDFASATDNSLWLNYTSIVEEGDGQGQNSNSRSISVKISDGSLPGGVSLKLSVGGVSTGNGTRGQSAATGKALTTSSQDVVTGIGSCYTETGENKGHQLTYALDMDNGNYQALEAGNYDVTVQYTISEDN